MGGEPAAVWGSNGSPREKLGRELDAGGDTSKMKASVRASNGHRPSMRQHLETRKPLQAPVDY